MFSSQYLLIGGCYRQKLTCTFRKMVKNVGKLTKVKLTICFLTVDDIKSVWYSRLHPTHIEVEPLEVSIRIYVWTQHQIILIFMHLWSRLCVNI